MNGGVINTPKSATVAGTLGIFLGAFGAHDWYLDNVKKARKHVALFSIGVLLLVASVLMRTFVGTAGQVVVVNLVRYGATVINAIAWLLIFGDIIWGIIEGAVLLAQGNDALAARGYQIVTPTPQDVTSVATPQNITQPSTTQPSITQSSTAPVNTSQTAAQPVSQPAPVSQPTSPASVTSQPSVAQAPVTTPPPQAVTPQPSPQSTPLVFHSGNISHPAQSAPLSQPLTSQNVAASPLELQDVQGRRLLTPTVKRILLILGIVVLSAVGIMVAIMIVQGGMNTAVSAGYGETYRAARELVDPINKASKTTSCEYALEYYQSTYVDRKTYDGYIENCQAPAAGVSELVDKLGRTTAIGWDETMAEQYEIFRELYYDLYPEGSTMMEALPLYQTWHNYVLAADLLTVDSEDVEFYQAAEILRKSGNQTLAQYGEEWLQRQLDYIRAYRTYWDTPYTDANKETLRQDMEAKRSELETWASSSRPDLTKLAPVVIPDPAPMLNSFNDLYATIRTAYEAHYDSNSGDCTEAGRVVYCS